jgi:hypothetical protein
MGWLGRKERAGWVKAPPAVELEIRSVWQEDEMPDEIKNAPGYRPFTLGLDAQGWVDSMVEIVDGGDAVYGRPRPITPQQHQPLTSPTPLPPLPAPTPFQPSQPPPVPSAPRVLVPDIDDAPLPPAQPPAPPGPRVLMPDVDVGPPPPARPRTLPRRVLMPDVGEDMERPEPKPPRPLMPDVGDDEEGPKPKPPRPLMPDIG